MLNNTILMIFPILLFIFAFYKAKVNRSDHIAEDYINLDQSKMIQAIACISIIYHHITQKITGYGAVYKGPITIYNYIGFLFTAVFFFFSGFGLITSFLNKPDYLKTFVTKRLPKVLIPFWIINLLGVLLNWIGYGIHYDLREALSDIFGLALINSNGWFIVEIVIIYLLFYAFFSLIKNKDIALILLSISIVLIIIYSFTQGHDIEGDKSHWFRGEWWYNSTITFIFGMIYARHREFLDRSLFKHYKAKIALFAVLSVVVINASVFVLNCYGYYGEGINGRNDAVVTLIVQSIACIICTTLVLLLNMRITVGNKALRYVSGISVELFLIHGYFVNRIFGDIPMSDFLRFMTGLVCSIICTAIVSPLIDRLIKVILSALNRERIVNDTLEAEIAEKNRAKRTKIVRNILAFVIIIVTFALLGMRFGRLIFAQSEYDSECEALSRADVGNVVYWGRFEADPKIPGEERVEWIVIDKKGDLVTLISAKGIAGSYYNQKHEEITWHDCDLRAILNSDRFVKMFSKYEIENVCDTHGDYFTWLTPTQAEEIFGDDTARKLDVTIAAELGGTNSNKLKKLHQWDMKWYASSWWWLRGENTDGEITAPIVETDGSIVKDTNYVNKPGGAIRPAIMVKIPVE